MELVREYGHLARLLTAMKIDKVTDHEAEQRFIEIKKELGL